VKGGKSLERRGGERETETKKGAFCANTGAEKKKKQKNKKALTIALMNIRERPEGKGASRSQGKTRQGKIQRLKAPSLVVGGGRKRVQERKRA